MLRAAAINIIGRNCENMRVLFINASKRWEGRVYREYPYGIGILATLANQAGYNIRILDMAVDDRDYRAFIREFQPDVVAVSFFSPSVQIASEVISVIADEFDVYILTGGIHSTLYPYTVLEYGADVVLKGEGEINFIPVLNCIRDEEECLDDKLADIPNLVFRNRLGKVITTGTSERCVDLDTLPVMNRNLFDLSFYDHHTILTSRCCPFKCHFCCSWAPGGKAGRIMSSERIIHELEWLVEQYGALTLYWGDEIFFWNREERLNFCDMLKARNLPIKFIVQLRADLVEEVLVEKLISVGCVKLCIGAESGSDKILREINKKITADVIEKAILTSVKMGLPCKTWWMVGLPGGDKGEQLKALDVIERARPNEVAVHQFVPLPGSYFWEHAKQYGIHLPEEALFESLNYYSDPSKLKYDYISGEELYDILKTYEKKLLQWGYVSTDLADSNSKYVFTTPFQKTTFEI